MRDTHPSSRSFPQFVWLLTLWACGCPVHGESLPVCTPEQERDFGEAAKQLGVVAQDRTAVFLARSANKKWASKLDRKVFGGRENWLSLDALPVTVCGKVDHVELFEHLLSGDEADVHYYLVPESGNLVSTLLRSLHTAAAADVAMCGTDGRDPCIYSEVTPNKAYEDALCGQSPGGGGKECGRGSAFGGAPWDGVTAVCIRGPLVLERFHGFRPEIHPAELTWGRLGSGGLVLNVVRDASQRFDKPFYFSGWVPGAKPAGAWSQGGRAGFTIWFKTTSASQGVPLKITNSLPSTTSVWVSSADAKPTKHDVGPAGLELNAPAVCQDRDGSAYASLQLSVEVQQNHGRSGASQAVALLVSRPGEMAAAATGPADTRERGAAPREILKELPLPTVRLDAWAVPNPDPDYPNLHALLVGADILPTASASEDERVFVEALNRTRDDSRLRKRLFGTAQPFEVTLKLKTTGRYPVRSVETINLHCPDHGELLYKARLNEAVHLDRASSINQWPLYPRGAGQPRGAFAEVLFCLPKGLKGDDVSVSVEATVSTSLAGRKLSSKASLQIPSDCRAGRAADARTFVKDVLHSTTKCTDKQMQTLASDMERPDDPLLELGEGRRAPKQADGEPRERLRRAILAAALSAAADCPTYLVESGYSGRRLVTALADAFCSAE